MILPAPQTLEALHALDTTTLTLLIESVAYRRHWEAYTAPGAVWPLYERTNGATRCCVRETELPAYGTDWQAAMGLWHHSGYALTLDEQPEGTVEVWVEGQLCVSLREPSEAEICRAVCAGILWSMLREDREAQARARP